MNLHGWLLMSDTFYDSRGTTPGPHKTAIVTVYMRRKLLSYLISVLLQFALWRVPQPQHTIDQPEALHSEMHTSRLDNGSRAQQSAALMAPALGATGCPNAAAPSRPPSQQPFQPLWGKMTTR